MGTWWPFSMKEIHITDKFISQTNLDIQNTTSSYTITHTTVFAPPYLITELVLKILRLKLLR